jgi:hypothetical protein
MDFKNPCRLGPQERWQFGPVSHPVFLPARNASSQSLPGRIRNYILIVAVAGPPCALSPRRRGTGSGVMFLLIFRNTS